ncbi:MAG: N-acyl homoserine lactonase family protein [Hyphomicrobiaceae bacterium]
MKMHVLSGGRLRMKKAIYLPDADRSETIELPVSSMLLRHPQANVLFDTGCHPSVVDDAEARWGAMAKAVVPIMAPGDHVLTGLASIGLSADDIDIVVNSHFHPDHCGCNAFFKRATVMVHARELEAAKAENAVAAGYLPVEWQHTMPMDPFDAQRDVFGDGRLVLIPLPGHTPGTTGALVGLERSGSFFLASDAVSLRASLDRDIVPRNTWNAELLLASLAEIRRIETGGATVVCGHDAAQWGTLRKGGHAYD